jgi:putative tryptophan/tyrosine transport system substrate-binding protein
MRRRQLISLVGSAVVAWPFSARGQQAEPMRRIGVLMGLAASDPGGQSEVAALKQGLQALGWIEGRNVQIELGGASSELQQIQASAKELVALQYDVIVGRSTPVVAALLKETRTIPIVFVVVVDPVGSGFTASLARPGGNVTGFQNYEFTMVGKWLELLKQVAPDVTRVAMIYNPTTVPYEFVRRLEAIGPSLGLQPIQVPVRNAAEIDSAIATFEREPGGGMIVVPDIFNVANRVQIIGLAAKHRLPAVYTNVLHTRSNGLISYGPDTPDLFRRAASYVDRILKGEKPADLPVQQPTKYELIINLKTAKAFGITIPPALLTIADEVIE